MRNRRTRVATHTLLLYGRGYRRTAGMVVDNVKYLRSELMSYELQSIELDLLAGIHPNGQPVLEKVRAFALPRTNHFQLLQSPLFATGVASGDQIEMLVNNPGRFRVHQRSGQLSVRVFSRSDIAEVADELTPAIEKLGGQLDVQSARALVYSIHVAVGFRDIEEV